jgi:hypothetical protein
MSFVNNTNSMTLLCKKINIIKRSDVKTKQLYQKKFKIILLKFTLFTLLFLSVYTANSFNFVIAKKNCTTAEQLVCGGITYGVVKGCKVASCANPDAPLSCPIGQLVACPIIGKLTKSGCQQLICDDEKNNPLPPSPSGTSTGDSTGGPGGGTCSGSCTFGDDQGEVITSDTTGGTTDGQGTIAVTEGPVGQNGVVSWQDSNGNPTGPGGDTVAHTASCDNDPTNCMSIN